MTKTVLITGASRGIGAACARRFAREGYRVAIHYNTNKIAAEAVQSDLTAIGAETFLLQADLADAEQVTDMFRKMEKEFGPADVLINNAGIAQQKLFTDITEEDWKRMMGVDLDGVFRCTQHAL